jgi:hypothetical protein
MSPQHHNNRKRHHPVPALAGRPSLSDNGAGNGENRNAARLVYSRGPGRGDSAAGLCGRALPDAPALAGTPAAPEPAEPPPQPVLRHEASAECWMKYDKSGGSLEAKTRLVGKCIDDRMKLQKPQ